MGRKPIRPSERKSNQYLFQADTEHMEIMDSLFLIAKREGKDMKDIYFQAFAEFVEKHGDGNYQTLLRSYTPDGPRSTTQAMNDYVLGVVKQGMRQVHWRDIVNFLKERDCKKTDLVKTAENVAKSLKEKGVKVWR